MAESHTPDDIRDHPDPCPCDRCKGHEACPACGRVKLDIDWCFSCRRLVFLHGYWVTPRGNASGGRAS